MSKDTSISTEKSFIPRQTVEIPISEEALKIEAQSTVLKNVLKWAVGGLSSGLLYQGLLSIGFVSLVVFLGFQEGFTYFWSFVFLALSLGISNLITLILGLFVGTLSDIFGKRKLLVLIFTSISIVLFATIASWMNFYFTIILFILGNSLFQVSRIVLNSQILFISDSKNRGLVNGLNGVFHFGGAIFGIIVTLILLSIFGEFTSLADIQNGLIAAQDIQFGGIRWIFPICAFIMLLSLIPYFFLKEKEKYTDKIKDDDGKIPHRNITSRTFSEIKKGFKDFTKNRNLIIFLLGWFFVSCGITIATVFLYEFIKRLIQKDEWIILLILGTIALAAIISSYFSGSFIDEIGPKIASAFNITTMIIGILVTAISGYSTYEKIVVGTQATTIVHQISWWLIFFGAFFIGFSLGGFWVIGKQFLIELSPPKKIGQSFGFMNVINQMGAVFGTLIFYGLISIINNYYEEADSYRISLFIILGLFMLSIFCFVFIKDLHPRYIAGEREPFAEKSIKLRRESEKINFFAKILYRLQYIFGKFNVVLGIIKAISWFVILLELVFDISVPFWGYIVAAVIGIPSITLFVYFIELFDDAWQAEMWTQFDMMEAEIFYDQTNWNQLRNVIAMRMSEEEKTIKSEQLHKTLNLDSELIEYETLLEIKKIKEEKTLKN